MGFTAAAGGAAKEANKGFLAAAAGGAAKEAVSTLGDMAFQYWALKRQENQADNLNKIARRIDERDFGESKRRFGKEFGLAKAKFGEDKKMNRFNQIMAMSDRIQSNLQRNPKAARQMMEIQSMRRA